MGNLYLIGGPMGVGKTTVGLELERLLPDCAFLDGDWCWHMDPWQVTEATRAMVLDNIGHVLRNFLACGAYRNVVFCWVMHRPDIWQAVEQGVAGAARGWQVKRVCLVCTPRALARRAGSRGPGAVARSLAYLPLYEALGLPLLDTTGRTPRQVAQAIAAPPRPG